MDQLNETTQRKLNPEVVSPVKELLDGSTSDTAND
jgi:hypothetical protein